MQVSTLPYLSLSFHSDTLPEHLPYPINHRKNTPPYIEYLPHLLHPCHLSLHTCTHLTLPFITYPNLRFPILYYCHGLIKYNAETTQDRTTQAETTQGRNERPENAVAVVEQERTSQQTHNVSVTFSKGPNLVMLNLTLRKRFYYILFLRGFTLELMQCYKKSFLAYSTVKVIFNFKSFFQ